VPAVLDYFEARGWIRLQARQAVEVFDILDRQFDVPALTQRMQDRFATRESHEFRRIDRMVAFFQSPACLSKALALYFEESVAIESCGHCLACKGRPAVIERTMSLEPLEHMNLKDLCAGYLEVCESFTSARDRVKFLCGIQSPFFRPEGSSGCPISVSSSTIRSG
jgi:ATP-dependent DNA helicase RecQ